MNGSTTETTTIFKQIQIETKFDCNLRCKFCPNSLKEPTGHEMSNELYLKILEELQEMGYKNRITLYLRNEPLMDSRLNDFIVLARTMFPENRINTSTNAKLLTNKMLEDLFNAGLTDLDISCYDSATYYRWISYSSDKIAVHDIRFNPPWLYNRGGYINIGCGAIGKGFCGRPQIQLYVTSEGKCVLCCSDFFEDVVLGDLNKQTIKEVWNSDLYKEYREKLKTDEGRATLKLCKDCNYTGW